MKKLRAFYSQQAGQDAPRSKLVGHDDPRSKKKAPISFRLPGHKSGNDLLSREIPVSSAFESLTTVFGMGTGVTSQVESPENRGPLVTRAQALMIWDTLFSGMRKSVTLTIYHSGNCSQFYQYSRAQPASYLFTSAAVSVKYYSISCLITCKTLLNTLRKKVKPHDKLVPVS